MKKLDEPPMKRSILAPHSLMRKVLYSLDHSEPQTTRDLSQKMNLHQSSVSHTLKELMEWDLVAKKGKSYQLSNLGLIEKNTLDWMERTLRCLKDYRDFFKAMTSPEYPKASR